MGMLTSRPVVYTGASNGGRKGVNGILVGVGMLVIGVVGLVV
jgi:hypothetical protein